MFTGTYTAIVTPFKNGRLDEAALARLVKNQIKGGVEGIVPVGTTGESPTVDCEEHIRIIERSVKFARGKIKVLAGTGANSILSVVANSATSGLVAQISATGLTTGTAFSLGTLAALTTGKGISIAHTTSVIASGGSLLSLTSTSIDTSTTTGT